MVVIHYPADKYYTLCGQPFNMRKITIITTLVTCRACEKLLHEYDLPTKEDLQDKEENES